MRAQETIRHRTKFAFPPEGRRRHRGESGRNRKRPNHGCAIMLTNPETHASRLFRLNC